MATACAGGDDDGGAEEDEGQPQQGGTLTFGAEQFPANLNCIDALNNIAWCYYMAQVPVLWGAYEQLPDISYSPQLLEGEAEIDEGPPFTVTYNIKEAAAWSDGTPITAQDFVFSAEVNADTKNNFVHGGTGWDLITDSEVNNDKSVTFTFKEPYSQYKGLFSGSSGYLYPAHVLEGEDLTKVWNECICDPATGEPIGSGPFLVTEFKKNTRIVLEADKDWWGAEEYGGPYLDSIE
ncbi:MAG: ABC transporter substrate-binding protein, partial [Actinomycetota bacterium]